MPLTDQLRQRIAAAAFSLPDVIGQRMFGSDAYLVQGKMFAFLTGDTLVLKLSPAIGESLQRQGLAQPFTMKGNRFGDWLALSVATAEDAEQTLSFLPGAYDYVRRLATSESPAQRRRKSLNR